MYIVHEGALGGLAVASAAMGAFLASRAGFVRRSVHPDVKELNRFMDIVEWDSLLEAEQAAQAAEAEESVAPFMQAIASIELMGHFAA